MEQQAMADNQQMSLAGELSRQGSLSPTMEALRPGMAGSVMEAPERQGQREQMMGEIAMSMMPGAGITAFHGSPHNFSKFDMSKIGTGEGAQAYGHGLYAAENPNVAKEYAKNYKTRPDVEGMARSNGLGEISRDSASQIRRFANSGLDSMEEAKKIQRASIELRDKPKEVIAKIIDEYKAAMETSLYKVDIPDDQIAKMLDWDKPLSGQPELTTALGGAVRRMSPRKELDTFLNSDLAKSFPDIYEVEHAKRAFADGSDEAIADWFTKQQARPGGSASYNLFGNERGSGGYGRLSALMGGDVQASEALRKAGIPGIKYLDQSSMSGGQQTSNFVLFSDEIAKILERNGQPIGDLASTLSK